MAGSVQIPWYATGFRGDELEASLVEIAEVAMRYGATSYVLYRSRDDRYRFNQVTQFESKTDWERYWHGPEFVAFRTVSSSWFQVPVLYAWHDVVTAGSLQPALEATE